MPKRYGQACPVAKSLEVIGDRWTLLLVRDLLPGPKRFRDFAQGLKGIAPNILTDLLKRMADNGHVARRIYYDNHPRTENLLTDRGIILGVVVNVLTSRGPRHLLRINALKHDACR